MSPRWQFPVRLVLGAGLLAGGLACLRPGLPVVFHTLQPISARGQQARPALAVEVMPVLIPDLLQRPQIVLSRRLGGLELAAGHRWGNALEQDFQRVLVADLALILGSERIIASPGGPAVRATYRVEVDILHCEGRPAGTLSFLATWMITRPGGVEALRLGRTALEEPVAGPATEALVSAHDRVLARLAEDLAASLLELP